MRETVERRAYSPTRTLRNIVIGVIALAVVSTLAVTANATPNKVTICHPVGSATGGNTHAGYSIITPSNASSHIDEETGEPKHEHDGRVDFVVDADHPCPPQPTEEPEKHKYRVVAGMPRYRGEVFFARDGLFCSDIETSNRLRYWKTVCGQHVDRGELLSRTYVRLRDLTDGSVRVLIDRR